MSRAPRLSGRADAHRGTDRSVPLPCLPRPHPHEKETAMKGMGPRILLMGGNYRALCVLERLLDRGERVVAFIGEEGSGERDFCPEILEACDRAAVPARSGRKLGEEIVRWLEDRIRPDLAISVGLRTEVPLAVGGNCRLGLIEVVDAILPERTSVALRQSGSTVLERGLPCPLDEDDTAGDLFLQLAETTLLLVDEYLDRIGDRHSRPLVSIPYERPPAHSGASWGVEGDSEPGPHTTALEQTVAAYLGAERVVAVAAPEEGAELLLHSLGLERGDEIILPGIASQAFMGAARSCGLRPLLVDVDPRTLTLDPARLQESVSDRTRAVVVSHAFGQPADLAALEALTQARGIPLVEDAAAAFGARLGARHVAAGSLPALATLPWPGCASGRRATFLTLDRSRAETLLARSEKLRLSDAAAWCALQDLAGLEDELAARRRNAAHYSRELVRYDAFHVPLPGAEELPSYGAYALRVTSFARTSAEDLARLLAESGIETRTIAAVGSDRELSEVPLSERIRASTLLLPVSSALDEKLQGVVLDAIFDYAIG